MDNNQFNGINNTDVNTYSEQPVQNPYEVPQDKAFQNPYEVSRDKVVQNPYEAPQSISFHDSYVYTDSWMNNNYKGNNSPNPYQQNYCQTQNPYQQPYQAQNVNPYQQAAGQQPLTPQMGTGYYYVPGNFNMPQPEKTGNAGLAIAGMVCGIVSIVICCLWGVSLLVAIPGLILSIVALAKKCKGKGMAVAGVICSSLGIILFIIYTLLIYFDL